MSITLQIIICILVADFLTGLGHWLEDSYCLESYPIFGKSICKPNIDHHRYPKLMVESAHWLYTNLISMSISLFLVLVIYLFFGIFSWQILLIAILTGLGNQVHLWNHEIKSSYFVEFLKDSGIIQSQKQHSKHHIPPYDKSYCVLISFNNAWLDRINFWRKLENILDKIGLKVKRGTPEREGY